MAKVPSRRSNRPQTRIASLIAAFVLLIVTTFPLLMQISPEAGVWTGIKDMVEKRQGGQPSLAINQEWGANGTIINNALDNQEFPQVVSDGTGGAIIVWKDATGILAQRFNAAATLLWISGPVRFSSDSVTPLAISDGAGGAIVAWSISSVFSSDLYIQRVDSAGNLLWGPGGLFLGHTEDLNSIVVLKSDGVGGALLLMVGAVEMGPLATSVLRINSTGGSVWGNDVTNPNRLFDQPSGDLISDGAGGAIVAWVEDRSGGVMYDIYAQHFNATGHRQWGANGTAICNATRMQMDPQLVSDGNGGAIVSWRDNRTGNWDIYAQSVDAAGIAQWEINGTAICVAAYDQTNLACIPDGANGSILTWQDYRNGAGVSKLYAQLMNSKGQEQWDANGIALCPTPNNQTNCQVISGGNGSMILTWQDYRGGFYADIYTQRINVKGSPMWGANGTAICTAVDNQLNPQLASDESGGGIIVWQDERNPSTWVDIYAQRVRNILPATNHPGDLATSVTGSESIGWVLTDDQRGGRYRVMVNSTSGSYLEWQGWTGWTNNSALNIPVNRTTCGTFNYTIEYYDDQGLWGAPDTVIVTVVEPPSGLSISIDAGASETGNTSVSLTVAATGATEMCFSNDGGTYSPWEPLASDKAWALAGGPGPKIVFYKARNLTIESGPATDAITYILPPSNLFVFINYGAPETDNASVTLLLSAMDAAEMCFSNNGTTYTAWEPYVTSKAWTLASGVGLRNVYFKVRNGTIEAQAPATDSISLVSPSGGTEPGDNGLVPLLIALIMIIAATAFLLLLLQSRKITQLRRAVVGFKEQPGQIPTSRATQAPPVTTPVTPEPKSSPVKTPVSLAAKPLLPKTAPTPEPKPQTAKPLATQVPKPLPTKIAAGPEPKALPVKPPSSQAPKPQLARAPAAPAPKSPPQKASPALAPESQDQPPKTVPAKKARSKSAKK